MYIIKNRVTGEYDRKGYKGFHKVSRDTWDKLPYAKSHVAMRITNCVGICHDALAWYLDADFIEITDEGISTSVPVAKYIGEYFSNRYKAKYLTQEEINKIQAEVWND